MLLEIWRLEATTEGNGVRTGEKKRRFYKNIM